MDNNVEDKRHMATACGLVPVSCATCDHGLFVAGRRRLCRQGEEDRETAEDDSCRHWLPTVFAGHVFGTCCWEDL